MYAEDFNNLVEEICNQKGILLKRMSYGYILNLQKYSKNHYIIGYRFDLNTQVAGALAKDKYATYKILKENNIPTIKYEILFNELNREEYCKIRSLEKAKQFFYENNRKIVIKPNTGTEGKEVYLCEKEDSIEPILNKLCEKNNTMVLCPYYDIKTEYRTIFLNGECMLIYGKNIPCLVGDGKLNIKELLKKENIKNENLREENIKNGIDFNYIPKENEEVKVFWKHNLSCVANPIILEDENLKSRIESIVKKAAAAIGINFASIDVIETVTGELYVMEINSGICMKNFMEKHPKGREIAKNIYSKAIEEMIYTESENI